MRKILYFVIALSFALISVHSDAQDKKSSKVKKTNPSAKRKMSGNSLKDGLGVVSYTFRKSFQKDVGSTLDTVKAMGFTNIEFSNLFGRTAAEIKQLLDARGMRCTSFGVKYEDLQGDIKQVAANAKALGASFVRVAWIPHDKNAGFKIEDAKRAVNDFNNWGKLLKDEFGLNFVYHNHGYEFQPYENGTFFDYIVANTNPEHVNFEIDILWVAHPGHDPAALIKKYPDRFKLMHVKDLRKGVVGDFSGGTPIENDVTLGTGQIDIAAAIKAAEKSAIQYYYIEDESNDVNTQVPASLAFLKKL